VVEAITSAIGPAGTMLMMVAADDRVPFDRLTTPADPENGILAEVFRSQPGVLVNDHPACRFAARGPAAANAENLARLAIKHRVTRRYVRADAGPLDVEGIDDTDGIAHWAGGDYFPRILVDFLATGDARAGPVGRCRAELLDARTFVGFAVAWIERNPAPTCAVPTEQLTERPAPGNNCRSVAHLGRWVDCSMGGAAGRR
jgi:Aminoglycoside 3-N-acetyltransferase